MWNNSNLLFLNRIDRKMSSSHTNYKLDEAQAIMSELRTIKKAICTGEKERRDLMQVKPRLPPENSVCRPVCHLLHFIYLLYI